jgi:NADPH:quinone reductase-like Zn-dependent oxidoreductase
MFGTCSAERLELVRSLGADAAGKLTPVIDSVIPLARAAEAHERMKSCAVKGKIVLDCS